MSDHYHILQVQPEWALESEDMGTKEKFWYQKPGDDGRNWLFKRPRPETGEHWAEKIAAEVAKVLRVPHATAKLAEFQDQRGSVSQSFVSDGQELWQRQSDHGMDGARLRPEHPTRSIGSFV